MSEVPREVREAMEEANPEPQKTTRLLITKEPVVEGEYRLYLEIRLQSIGIRVFQYKLIPLPIVRDSLPYSENELEGFPSGDGVPHAE